jgi:hypothetical protein
MLDYHEHLEIEERLKGDLAKARAEYQVACGEVDSLVKEFSSGVAQRDGELRVRQTGETSGVALRNYILALQRFSQYTLSGIVPKDLLPPMNADERR